MNTFVQQIFVEHLLGIGHSADGWRNSDIAPGSMELTAWWEKRRQ